MWRPKPLYIKLAGCLYIDLWYQIKRKMDFFQLSSADNIVHMSHKLVSSGRYIFHVSDDSHKT